MANGLSKFMNFLKLTDEDDEFDDDFYDDDYDDEKELEREERRLLKEQKREEKHTASRRSDTYYEREEPVSPAPKRSAPVSSYRSSSAGSKVVQMPSSNNDLEVCIVKPGNIGEAQQVCDLLLNSHPVVVNLEGIDIMEAQRIMDFISGCIFAISGNMCQVSRYIFIFSPKDVDISGDYIKSLENEESYNIAAFSREF